MIPEGAWVPPPIVLTEPLSGIFLGLIKRFFKVRETLDPQVSSIHKATVRPFGGLTMRFFKGLTLGWNLQNSDVQLFVILETWKTIPAMSLYPPIQANCLHVNHCSKFWVLEKVFLQRFMRPSDKGFLTFIEIQLGIMSAGNKVSLIVLKAAAQS
jgi:hypothetical protein